MGQALAHVGLDVTRRPLDLRQVAERSRSGNHDGLVLVAMGVRDEANPLAYWNVPYEEGVFARTEPTPAYDDWVASLVDRYERALQPERRRQALEALAAAFAEKLPALPLFYSTERVVADPALRGWEDTPPYSHFYAEIEEWYFVR